MPEPYQSSIPPPSSPSPHTSLPSSPSLSRPRTPRPRASPRQSPVIHRSSSYLSSNPYTNGGTSSIEGSPRLLPVADPHHHRAPSLGELHQELESEQEGRVNRLLGMIRQQQVQLDSVNSNSTTNPPRSRTPSSHRASLSIPIPASTSSASSVQNQPQPSTHRSPSTTTLPHLSLGGPSIKSPSNPVESPDWLPREKEKDELTFLQAEAAMMERENRMLKVRVAELERLVAGSKAGDGAQAMLEKEDGTRGRQ